MLELEQLLTRYKLKKNDQILVNASSIRQHHRYNTRSKRNVKHVNTNSLKMTNNEKNKTSFSSISTDSCLTKKIKKCKKDVNRYHIQQNIPKDFCHDVNSKFNCDRNLYDHNMNKKVIFSQNNVCKNIIQHPTVSLHALERARTTIEDFYKTYFILHQLSIDDFFRVMPTLIWMEGTIYQMDEQNEFITKSAMKLEQNHLKKEKNQIPRPNGIVLDGENILLTCLKKRGLWDQRIQKEWEDGKTYWATERELCRKIMTKESIDLKKVIFCSLRKSFDYRLLHLVLLKMLGRCHTSHIEQLFKFLWFDEHLVDIHDDLYDYEKDVLNNSFNIYRFFIYCFGAKEGQIQLISRITRFENYKIGVFNKLPHDLQCIFKKREEHAYQEGGKGSNKWIFPSPIINEMQYRNTM